MGGYGSLLLAETFPGFVRAVAAFSPAVSPGDDVFTGGAALRGVPVGLGGAPGAPGGHVFPGAAALRGVPVGLWCGTDDGLLADVHALERALPQPKAAGSY